jgi:hypothetical protein
MYYVNNEVVHSGILLQPNSDLIGMIQILTIVFGEEPPVYSRQQQQAPPIRYPNQTPYPQAGQYHDFFFHYHLLQL